ncbi:MAG: hypothetical protein AABZ12_11795 [Planctomycetota bacterium]
MAGAALLLTGCFKISVEPSCPQTLQIGESGPVAANEQDPGEIPTYLWEVLPQSAGEFADAARPTTTFTASAPGAAVIRLTASDGLFQVVAECTTQIGGADVQVSLSADPSPGTAGQSVTLACESVGSTPPAALVIDQLDGPPVTLDPVVDGLTSFTPTSEGNYTFRCIGTSAGGEAGDPSVVDLTVEAGGGRPGGGRPGR